MARMTQFKTAVVGFFAASVAPPLLFAFFAPLHGSLDFYSAVGAFLMTWPFSMIAMVLFGIPTYLLFRSFKLTSWWLAIVAGGIDGSLVAALSQPPDFRDSILLGASGAAAAIVFRLAWELWPLDRRREVESRKNKRGWKKWLPITAVLVLAGVLCNATLIACLTYADWYAEKSAHQFCDEIAIGSDVSTATARAIDREIKFGPSSALEKKLLWKGAASGAYTFYFFGAFPFDKAVCEVSVGREGNVRSKFTEMEYD
jgi:hypothetical protein